MAPPLLQVPGNSTRAWAYTYGGPAKMMSMAHGIGPKNHDAMMKSAKKVSHKTVFLMNGGELY